jgi:hypothetical protein
MVEDRGRKSLLKGRGSMLKRQYNNIVKGEASAYLTKDGTVIPLTIRKRIVLKNGKINVHVIRISSESSHYLTDTFTTLVDAKWRYTLLAFGLSFLLSWLIFAGLYYLVMYINHDFDPGNLPDVNVRNSNPESQVQLFLLVYSVLQDGGVLRDNVTLRLLKDKTNTIYQIIKI